MVALCIVQLQNIAPHTTEPDIQEFETERNALYYILTAIWAMWNRPHEKSIRRLKGLRFLTASFSFRGLRNHFFVKHFFWLYVSTVVKSKVKISQNFVASQNLWTLIVICKAKSRFFEKNWYDFTGCFLSEALVLKPKLLIRIIHIFYKTENFKMEEKRANKLTSAILEQSWCSILGNWCKNECFWQRTTCIRSDEITYKVLSFRVQKRCERGKKMKVRQVVNKFCLAVLHIYHSFFN